MTAVTQPAPPSFPAALNWSGFLLGFAIGGFFDGILLHQILQWHHLLSALEQAGDLRFQVMADGLFHALMYVVTLVGMWLLWKARSAFAAPHADRTLLSWALVGFGAWHIVDGIVSHWVLGIHRIRMDSANPLFWDLLWFVVFGVAFVVAGYFVRSGGRGRSGGARHAPAALAAIAVIAGGGAALPAAQDGAPVVVVFRPGLDPAAAFAAMTSVDGRLVWSDRRDHVWAIDVPKGISLLPLYRHGAIMVSGSIVPLGCLDWFRS